MWNACRYHIATCSYCLHIGIWHNIDTMYWYISHVTKAQCISQFTDIAGWQGHSLVRCFCPASGVQTMARAFARASNMSTLKFLSWAVGLISHGGSHMARRGFSTRSTSSTKRHRMTFRSCTRAQVRGCGMYVCRQLEMSGETRTQSATPCGQSAYLPLATTGILVTPRHQLAHPRTSHRRVGTMRV